MPTLYDYSSYHNIHQGRRVFILGTGPSILNLELDKLAALAYEYTIGINFLLKIPAFPFLPTYYTANEYDPLVDIETEVYRGEKRFNSTTDRWMSNPEPHHGRDKAQQWKWVYRDHDMKMWEGYFRGFEDGFRYPNEKPFERVAWGYSAVLDLPVQLACWMGFTEVYLLGCDHTREGYAYDKDWVRARANVEIARDSAMVAERVMGEHGVRLVDLTEGGTLPITNSTLEKVL